MLNWVSSKNSTDSCKVLGCCYCKSHIIFYIAPGMLTAGPWHGETVWYTQHKSVWKIKSSIHSKDFFLPAQVSAKRQIHSTDVWHCKKSVEAEPACRTGATNQMIPLVCLARKPNNLFMPQGPITIYIFIWRQYLAALFIKSLFWSHWNYR